MSKWIYPKFLSYEQVNALRDKYKTNYALSRAAKTNCFYTNQHLERKRKVFRSSVKKYARALGISIAEFEDLEQLPI